MPRLFLPMEHTTERGIGRRVAHPPHSLPPLFHSEFSFLENRAETLPLSPSPLLPLILKLQIERDIRVLFRRMSRWKRSRRDSRPQHPPPPRYYPRLSSDSTNPRQGLNPTQPRRFEEWRGSSQAGCLAHAAFPLPRSTPFPSAFPSSLSTFPSPLSSPHSPPLSRFPTFLRQRRCCHYYYSPTSLWSVSPLPSLPPPAIPAPFSLPFFVISPLLSCLSSPLYYHSPTQQQQRWRRCHSSFLEPLTSASSRN